MAILDEALTILEYAVIDAYRPKAAELRAARQAVSSYLDTLRHAFIGPADQPPELPLSEIRSSSIPLVSHERFAAILEKHCYRRRLLRSLVRNDGWDDRNL